MIQQLLYLGITALASSMSAKLAFSHERIVATPQIIGALENDNNFPSPDKFYTVSSL